MAKSNEPIFWAPFMAGAGLSALLMPITIVITSVAVLRGWVTADRMYELLGNPFVRVYLGVLICLSLMHGAHRLRFVLVDLGLKPVHNAVAFVCYGAAIAGSAFAIYALVTV